MPNNKTEVFRSNAPQEMAVTEGSDTTHKKPAEGPSKLRQISDHNATGTAGERELAEVNIAKHGDEGLGETTISEQADAKAAADAPAVAAPVVPAMIEKDDAIPWALSIHLEERIKGLGLKTAAVNQELDSLEASSQKLAQRIGK